MPTWLENRSGAGNHLEINAAPLEADPKPPDISSTGSATPSSSRKFPLRRFGDLFRNKLRSSGSYSIKTLNDSVATIAKDQKLPESKPSIADLEKILPAPVKTLERPAGQIPVKAIIEQGSSGAATTNGATVTAAAVVVNEKQPQQPVRNGTSAGHYGGRGGGAVGTGVRSRKVATLNRTFQRKKGTKPISSAGDGTTFKIVRTAADVVEPISGGGGGQKRQSISSQDTTTTESEVIVGKSATIVGRDRVNSASHYSTEKSGSSGYYSTNIYFAGGSVVDEHIYYEPVDRGRKNSSDGGVKVEEGGGVVGKGGGILKNGGDPGLKSGRTLEQYYYPAALENVPNEVTVMRAKQLSTEKLTDIVEGPDGPIPRPIWPLDVDDSLADINLEAFRMRHSSQQNLIGFESPASSNSDNEIYSISKKAVDEKAGKKSQYEEYLEFHNTRNILEQIKGKLNTLLEQRSDNQKANANGGHGYTKPTPAETELEEKIANLKSDLEGYLQSMNQKNENEIKRFCKGMSKDAKVLAVQNAVEHRNRSRTNSLNLENEYEVLEGSKPNPATLKPFYSAVPHRTLTNYPKEDPKTADSQPSYFETVYVRDGFNVRQLNRTAPNPFAQEVRTAQMLLQQQRLRERDQQREMAYQRGYFGTSEETKSAADRRPSKVSIEVPDGGRGMYSSSSNVGGGGGIASEMAAAASGGNSILVDGRLRHKSEIGVGGGNNLGKSGGVAAAGGDVSDFTLQRVILMESLGKSGKLFGDKEKMLLEYHLNKPSYWELYYGANREEQQPHHTLIRKVKIGGKNAIAVSYPSTRPESDFTLDLPRAEQLRVKMKKEKQFRNRCRWIFYFLSVVFFLLSVMVVSLILTRGKRMFGSMI